jgi:rod shape determining protein RodA
MGVLRVERAAPTGIAAKVGGIAWRSFDLQLFVYAGLLATLGLTMAYSNSSTAGADVTQAGTTFVRGLMWAVIALAAFAAATFFDYTWLRSFAWPLYLVNLALLAATLVLGSTDEVASARWISVLGFQFQFSELAKVLMILVLARYLGDREQRLDSFSAILGACLIVVPPLVLVVLQPDLGTSLCLIAILGGMLFMSGASLLRLGILAVAGIAALPLIWTYGLHDYQRERLTSFIDPSADPLGAGFQQLAAQKVVSSGGLLGAGLTNGVDDKTNLLPVQTTDFVFAKLAQELGFVGCAVVFLLFAALLWRIVTIAWRSRDPFGLLVGCGVASMVLFQIAENVGMVLGVMPVAGIPLPFITHGGASLVSVGIGLGIMESVALRQQRAEW